MDKYITKSDAVFAACKVLDKFGGCSMGPFCPDSGCREVREVFDNVPAADVAEVVRCRECIHWSDKWEAVSIPGAHYCRKMGLFKLPSYYCADGERKDGGRANESKMRLH